MKIAFLHTSKSHINRFEKIVTEIDCLIEIEHFVNEGLLETAMKDSAIDKEGFKNEITKIRSHKIENIICTCTTYGALCKEEEKIYRIDQPIVELIVSKYTKIGIAYTAKSTKEITKNLFKKIATREKKPIEWIEIDCLHCWQYFEAQDFDKYAYEIAEQIKRMGKHCEVIFLAQASMENAKEYLTKEQYETVSSPKYGVEKHLERIKQEGCA